MSQLKRCDRCKKAVSDDLEIGVTVDFCSYSVRRGFIRPQKSLRDACETTPPTEYFPIEFTKRPVGEFDLCNKCFEEFMSFNDLD